MLRERAWMVHRSKVPRARASYLQLSTTGVGGIGTVQVAGGFVLAAVSYISTGSINWSSVVLFAGAFTVVFLLLGLWFSV